MKNLIILLLLLVFLPGKKSSANAWTGKANLPFAVSGSASFTVGNYGYLVGGSGTNNYSNSTFQYDPANDLWTQKADAGTVLRAAGVGFSLNGKGYIGMGLNNVDSVLKDLLQYDPVANTWTSKANIPQKRYGASVMTTSTKIFVTCGSSDYNSGAVLNDLWEYNVSSNTWTSRAAFPGAARFGASGFSISGSGYLFGGADSNAVNIYNDLWMYNPAQNTWTQQSPLPAASRGFAIAFSIGNYAYVGSGSDLVNDYTDFWRYDPLNDIWLITDSLGSVGRDAAFSFVVNNIGYVGGGEDSVANDLDDFWEFIPDSNIFVQEIKGINASVTIGPDPVVSTTVFTINSSQPLKNPVLRIYNSSGDVVKTVFVKIPDTEISFSDNKDGIYYYGIFSGNQFVKSGKLMVVHSN